MSGARMGGWTVNGPLFPRWTNSALRGALAALGLVAIGAPCLLMLAMRAPPVTGQDATIEQPIEFDHRHHVRDEGIDCRYCHEGAERGAHAGVPPTERCLNCHAQIWDRAALLAPVRASLDSGEPIRWRRVHRLPDFVFFNHAAHTARGVGCASCHGAVDTMAKVRQVAPLTMGWCLDCHRHPERVAAPAGAPHRQRVGAAPRRPGAHRPRPRPGRGHRAAAALLRLPPLTPMERA